MRGTTELSGASLDRSPGGCQVLARGFWQLLGCYCSGSGDPFFIIEGDTRHRGGGGEGSGGRNITWDLVFLFFYGFFRGLEWFHDVPDPSGIIFGPGITQNRGMASIFDQFSTFLDKSSPQFPNSFRKSRSHVASQAKVLPGK